MADDDMTGTLITGVGVLDVAEYCDSVSVISTAIDHALLRNGQTLFQSIAGNPAAWSMLAIRLKSKVIFKESVIHLIGRRREFGQEEMSELDDRTRVMCEVKFYDCEVRNKALEMRMLAHYPTQIIAESHKHPARTQYANDIYMWLSMALFRHWFGQSILERQGRAPIDGCFCFYRQLANAGQAYLSREQCEEFHRFSPMTGRGKTAFEASLTIYESEIASFVKPLMENKTQLIPETAATLGHFVCIDVDEKDYLWVEVAEEETEADGNSI